MSYRDNFNVCSFIFLYILFVLISFDFSFFLIVLIREINIIYTHFVPYNPGGDGQFVEVLISYNDISKALYSFKTCNINR